MQFQLTKKVERGDFNTYLHKQYNIFLNTHTYTYTRIEKLYLFIQLILHHSIFVSDKIYIGKRIILLNIIF
jgi:hypothetical protein